MGNFSEQNWGVLRERRHYGRALTEAAVGLAVEAGCDFVYLEASAMGFTVYETMGFKSVSQAHIYVEPASPDEPAGRVEAPRGTARVPPGAREAPRSARP